MLSSFAKKFKAETNTFFGVKIALLVFYKFQFKWLPFMVHTKFEKGTSRKKRTLYFQKSNQIKLE